MNEITCNVCHREFEREAPEGVTLQPTHDFVCEECQSAHNEATGAVAAEQQRLQEEREALGLAPAEVLTVEAAPELAELPANEAPQLEAAPEQPAPDVSPEV